LFNEVGLAQVLPPRLHDRDIRQMMDKKNNTDTASGFEHFCFWSVQVIIIFWLVKIL
jgi:hypothetical protein